MLSEYDPQTMEEEAANQTAAMAVPARFRTVHAPLLRVTTAGPSAPAMSAQAAGRLLVDILQHILGQLELTPGSWSEMEDAKQQAECDARDSNRRPSMQHRKFLKMVSSLDSTFLSIVRTFVAPTPHTTTAEFAGESPPQSFPHVEEALVTFGSSESSPSMAFRLCLAYEQGVGAPPSSGPAADQEQALHRALSRNVIRQLMNQTEALFPAKQPPAMRSPNTRLRVFFRLRHHPHPDLRLQRQPTPHPHSRSQPPREFHTIDDASLVAVEEEVSFLEYTRLAFKPSFLPRLVASYSVPLPPSSDSESLASSAHRRRAAVRAPRLRGCVPVTLLIGSVEQQDCMAAKLEASLPSSAHQTTEPQPDHEPFFEADQRLVIQRVTSASVSVSGSTVGSISRGLLVLVGFGPSDRASDAAYLSRKLLSLRLWEDAPGTSDAPKPWAASVMQRGFDVLLVSQFTLYATLKGNKPDFHLAAPPAPAAAAYAAFVERVRREYKGGRVETGVFGADMQVALVNDGPVTISLDTDGMDFAKENQKEDAHKARWTKGAKGGKAVEGAKQANHTQDTPDPMATPSPSLTPIATASGEQAEAAAQREEAPTNDAVAVAAPPTPQPAAAEQSSASPPSLTSLDASPSSLSSAGVAVSPPSPRLVGIELNPGPRTPAEDLDLFEDDEDMQLAWAVAASVADSSASSSSSSSSSGLPSPSAFPLVALPFELIASVHSFLDASTLLTGVAVTARDLRDMVLEDVDLWRHLCMRRFRLAGHEIDSGLAIDVEDGQSVRMAPAGEWFRQHPASANSSCANPWLRTYRGFALTLPRPLRLRALHVVDDEQWRRGALGEDVAALERRVYGVDNLLRPEGKAFCTSRNRNVQVILALAPTSADSQSAVAADLTTPLLAADSAASASSSSAASPMPLPPAFLLTDFQVRAPASGYTGPLSAGLLFFCDALPTPSQIQAWDDWSEQQWADRERALQEDAAGRLEKECSEGVERGDAEVRPMEEEAQVENWYADTLQHRSADQPTLDAYPLHFTHSASDEFGEVAQPGELPHVAPLAAFFRLEDNGIVLQSHAAPVPASSAPSAPSSRAAQAPYSYRHHFPQPVYGRFIVLHFLRASLEQTNIDVSFFGVKGYRRGMHATAPAPPTQASAQTATETEPATGSTAAAVDPDAADDAYDFDLPVPAANDVTSRLRAHLQSLQRMGLGMAQEVAIMDAHLERVQNAVQAQQRAQQQQQQLRVRMLLLQTQQLQLQLQSQHMQTRQTLAHAQQLNDRAALFMEQRRTVLSAVELEREAHRQRLSQLTEEKEREEAMLHTLRARVREAQQREQELREQLERNHAARDRLLAGQTHVTQPQPQPPAELVQQQGSQETTGSSSSFSATAGPSSGAAPSSVGFASWSPISSADLPSATPLASALAAASVPSSSASTLVAPVGSARSHDAATRAISSSLSTAQELSSRTSELLARLRDSRLQREAESRAVFERMHRRRLNTQADVARPTTDDDHQDGEQQGMEDAP